MRKIVLLVMTTVMLCACHPWKRTIYMQDAEHSNAVSQMVDYQIRFKPLDRITVVVSSKDPELAAPFNATSSYNSLSNNPLGSSYSGGVTSLQVRTINKEGYLDMPIIGTIYCTGKTRQELSDEIAKKIKDDGYISDAIVNIQFADMKIFVLGEVARPGEFVITRDHISILEALAMAGDMTIYGNRSNVLIVRQCDGKEKFIKMNLLDTNIFSSEGYFLQQGDVVYVQPNKYKSATAEINQNRTFWLSIVSTLISIATLLVTITKK
ncbi:MAG: polysaccharide biosynthesis/export family protein [Alistipes sp.]|nr:polysaccharide biosynthesis/export family protein [Candidatus Alistipes equi]